MASITRGAIGLLNRGEQGPFVVQVSFDLFPPYIAGA
jgi:hypothetical protein